MWDIKCGLGLFISSRDEQVDICESVLMLFEKFAIFFQIDFNHVKAQLFVVYVYPSEWKFH